MTGREGREDDGLVRETVREYVPPVGSESYPAPAPLPDGPDEAKPDEDHPDEDAPEDAPKGKHKR